jgi:hypothetical protein
LLLIPERIITLPGARPLMRAMPLPYVVVCSKNPAKVLAVKEAFSKALPHLKLDFTGVSFPEGWVGRLHPAIPAWRAPG